MLIYLCDDSKSDMLRLKRYLNSYAKEKNMYFEFAAFASCEELLAAYRQASPRPELMFLDIYMLGQNGMDTAKHLRSMQYQGGIIFTTSSTEHAMDSYEVNALYYLQKPYDRDHFFHAMDRCGRLLQKAKPHFTFTQRKTEISVPYEDIVFFETGKSHTLLLHTVSGVFSFPGALTQIAAFFHGMECFLPIGRSFLIHLDHVSRLSGNDFLMSDGSIVQIPLRKQADVLAAWENYKKETPL